MMTNICKVQTFQSTKDLLLKLVLMYETSFLDSDSLTILIVKNNDPDTINDIECNPEMGMFENFQKWLICQWIAGNLFVPVNKKLFSWLLDCIDSDIPLSLEERRLLSQLHSRLHK